MPPRKLDLLVAEIGSTTTAVNAFHGLGSPVTRFLGQGISRTTVEEGDVNLGLEAALRDLAGKLEQPVHWERLMATSSAAGGLRMSVHGMVFQMTARAAREAALGAGAVVRMVTAGALSSSDLQELTESEPSIILLAGGVDYGEKRTVLDNATRLAGWMKEYGRQIPVIFCGNTAAAKEAARIFSEAGMALTVTENVYPQIDRLNIEPARREIQRVFNAHIVDAQGMHWVRSMVGGEILPTPGAVMEAARLAARHIPDLLVFDVGGATTDVHSVTDGDEEIQRLLIDPEPAAKRTVEGDLGVYRNAGRLLEMIGGQDGCSFPDEVKEGTTAPIPQTKEQIALTRKMTEQAVKTALLRHVGRYRRLYGPTGVQNVVEGKDLTRVRWVIGTGGALTRLPGGKESMALAVRGETGQELLPKGELRFLLDRDYIMASVGAICREFPEDAWALLRQSLGL